MPTWSEFAWACFLYEAISGDRVYQQIMSNQELLDLMRHETRNLSPQTVQEHVITGFLNRWSCRLTNSSSVAKSIRDALQDLQPVLQATLSHTLRDPITTDANQKAQSITTLGDLIGNCYSTLYRCSKNFAATATSKLLHVLNPSLFVMWDVPILDYYHRIDRRIENSAKGYVLFHEYMHRLVIAIDREYTGANLIPQPQSGQVFEDYLSNQLKYSSSKGIAKFVDEYNWVVITREITVPPAWYPQ